jgi:hypothetical protein
VPKYRYYLINLNGRIDCPAIDYEAADDMEAVRYGRTLLEDQDIEVWQGARVVAYLSQESIPETE